MPSIYDWSTTPANNASSDAAITWAEGQAPSTVNNSSRQVMGRVAEIVGDLGGALSAGGTADGLTVSAHSQFTVYANGLVLSFRATANNTGPATLSVNAIGAKSIRKRDVTGDVPLAAGDMRSGLIYTVQYSTLANGGVGGWLLAGVLPVNTLTLPQINDTSSTHQYVFGVNELAADRTVTLPLLTGDDTFVFQAHTQTLTGKTLTSPTINSPAFGGSVPTGLDATTSAKGISEFATAAEIRTGTDTARSLVVDQVWASAAFVTLADAATIALDMATFINGEATVLGNRTLGNPTNAKVGQSGCIRVVASGADRTLNKGGNLRSSTTFPITIPSGTAADIFYFVVSSSYIVLNVVQVN